MATGMKIGRRQFIGQAAAAARWEFFEKLATVYAGIESGGGAGNQ